MPTKMRRNSSKIGTNQCILFQVLTISYIFIKIYNIFKNQKDMWHKMEHLKQSLTVCQHSTGALIYIYLGHGFCNSSTNILSSVKYML